MQNKIFFRQKITLIILGLIFSLIFLELSLRLGGVVVRTIQEYKNLLSIAHGGTYRVLCIGESTTQNQYPRFLESILNQRSKEIKFSVIDKGLTRTNSSVILDNIEKYLDTNRPHMVIAMMGNNDLYVMYYKDIFDADSALFRHYRTYQLMRLLYCRVMEKITQGIQSLQKNNKVGLQEKTFSRGDIRSFRLNAESAQGILANPKDVGYYVSLGWSKMRQGEIALAEGAFRQGIAKNPKDARCYAGLGWVYLAQGKVSQSEETFKKGIVADSTDAGCYIGLGSIYRDQNKLSLAEEILKKGIEVAPQNSGCYVCLGQVYVQQDKFALAEEILKKGIEVDPEDPSCYSSMGWLYEKQNRFASTKEWFKRGIQAKPHDDKLYGLMTLLYEQKGENDCAQEYYRKANAIRVKQFNSVTARNYRRLKMILDKRGIRLVCVQYPMRSIAPLNKVFEGDRQGIIFVDNEKIFREAIKRDGFKAYFIDMFGGDFGHCTDKGNKLLAENIARVVLKEVFHK